MLCFQAAVSAASGEDERRFRSLTFQDEEGRVRDAVDVYAHRSEEGLGEGLRRLRDERDRSDPVLLCVHVTVRPHGVQIFTIINWDGSWSSHFVKCWG